MIRRETVTHEPEQEGLKVTSHLLTSSELTNAQLISNEPLAGTYSTEDEIDGMKTHLRELHRLKDELHGDGADILDSHIQATKFTLKSLLRLLLSQLQTTGARLPNETETEVTCAIMVTNYNELD